MMIILVNHILFFIILEEFLSHVHNNCTIKIGLYRETALLPLEMVNIILVGSLDLVVQERIRLVVYHLMMLLCI